MYVINKTFGEYPFAHRQHTHKGHCRFVHGHNWRFKVKLKSEVLDENGFVYDFGQFKQLKEWFTEMFDHTLIINEDDPMIDFFKENEKYKDCKLWDLRIVPSGSAENLAKYIYGYINKNFIKDNSNYQLVSVTVLEDEKNNASYEQ